MFQRSKLISYLIQEISPPPEPEFFSLRAQYSQGQHRKIDLISTKASVHFRLFIFIFMKLADKEFLKFNTL